MTNKLNYLTNHVNHIERFQVEKGTRLILEKIILTEIVRLRTNWIVHSKYCTQVDKLVSYMYILLTFWKCFPCILVEQIYKYMVYDGSKFLTFGMKVIDNQEGKVRINRLELKTVWIDLSLI